jgi:hypothetical protein
MDKAALPIVRAKELATSSVAVDIEAPISGGHCVRKHQNDRGFRNASLRFVSVVK